MCFVETVSSSFDRVAQLIFPDSAAMKLELLAAVLALVVCVNSYDCYNQKCRGMYRYSKLYIPCNQRTHHCTVEYDTGYPHCEEGYPGNGRYCS